MTKISKQTQSRISKAVLFAERYSEAPTTLDRQNRVRTPQSWWGIVKAVIDNKASGDVYIQQGDCLNPTITGLTTYFPVANPWMGKLVIGMPVLVTAGSIRGVTGGVYWYVAPFHQVYEGKVGAGASIVAGGSGLVDLWEADAPISPAVTVTAYHRWTANIDLTPGTKVRLIWEIKLRRFLVDTWLCP